MIGLPQKQGSRELVDTTTFQWIPCLIPTQFFNIVQHHNCAINRSSSVFFRILPRRVLQNIKPELEVTLMLMYDINHITIWHRLIYVN